MIKGVHHPGIVVSDLNRAQQFYCEVLGFEIVLGLSWDESNDTVNQIIGLERSAAKACLLRGPNCYLEFFEYSAPKSTCSKSWLGANEPGIRHICFEVEDAFEEFQKVKTYDSNLIMNEPVLFQSGGSAVYCRDPFGNIIEFTTAGHRFPSLLQIDGHIERTEFTFK